MSSDAVGDEEADSAENGRVHVRERRHRLAALETAGAAAGTITMAQDFIGAKRDTIATKAH